MKSKKKIIALAIAVALLLVCFAGATFAYFTDFEAARTNTITVGNVEIVLYESENGYDADDLEDDKSALEADDADYQATYLDVHAPIVPAEEVAKNTYIENTGLNDAYVRFVVTVPKEMNEFVTLNWAEVGADKEFTLSGPVANADGDMEYTLTRNQALAPKEFTNAGLKSVELKADLTEADIAELVAGGFMDNADRTFNVLVRAEAIQTAGFANVTEAFAVFAANSSNEADNNM